MTHTASHIIISSLKTPTKANGGVPVYYYVIVACLLCFGLGFLAAL